MAEGSPPPSRGDAGDPATWLDQHGNALFGYAMRRLRDEEAAEELVQEALVAALEARTSFAGTSTVRTWLMGILRHKLLDHFRRGSRRASGGELPEAAVEADFSASGKWKQNPLRWGADPAAAHENGELLAALARCLDKLPARSAEALLLAEGHQHGGEDLRKVLETTTTNVYVMLHRARSSLRRCLEQTWLGAGSEDA